MKLSLQILLAALVAALACQLAASRTVVPNFAFLSQDPSKDGNFPPADPSSMSGAGAGAGASGSGSMCHPSCRYECPKQNDCPAQCKPICKKPKCKMMCDGLGPATCSVNCMKPRCQIECQDNFECTGKCPVCNNVCEEMSCQVDCKPPPANCKPLCEDPYCEWECYKPTECPMPKCKLVCDPVGSCHCCSCSNLNNAQAAIELAARAHDTLPSPDSLPTMIEIAHENRFTLHNHAQEQCCPCA